MAASYWSKRTGKSCKRGRKHAGSWKEVPSNLLTIHGSFELRPKKFRTVDGVLQQKVTLRMFEESSFSMEKKKEDKTVPHSHAKFSLPITAKFHISSLTSYLKLQTSLRWDGGDWIRRIQYSHVVNCLNAKGQTTHEKLRLIVGVTPSGTSKEYCFGTADFFLEVNLSLLLRGTLAQTRPRIMSSDQHVHSLILRSQLCRCRTPLQLSNSHQNSRLSMHAHNASMFYTVIGQCGILICQKGGVLDT